MSSSKSYHCLQCKAAFTEKGSAFPFCSARCQLLDLGAWAAEKYRVPVTEESDEDGFDPTVPEENPRRIGPSRK